ncbi:Mov34/MPN/PAD-1 family protein [Anaeromyxobacter paludicola]|uniref:JAB domain-containing protein n=1 Tax=Anaeromyxobacter paludicola TaxID=2918171 RepID=A0ABN6N3W8_9BACT|nr:Mov34/MPN/PAD-1 family protein [Anaeromyxobacter paludicola]BDG07886.1 hypothetical protein AMPC_09990 [Anaeromyxobacter paludicola]
MAPRRELPPAAGAYPAPLLAELARLCEETPDRERCGFVVREGEGGPLAAVPLPNVSPEPDAFTIDPLAHLRLAKRLRAGGGQVVAVWHSHVDAPAVLSARDREGAAPDGVEAIPGAEQLVLGLRAGRVVEIRRFVPVEGGFAEGSIRYSG